MGKIISLVAIALICGCASSESVVKLQGKGMKWQFKSDYANTWMAALDAARRDQLRVVSFDRASGFIEVKTPARLESWGERVAVWVRPIETNLTEVEVVSRMAGPHDLFWYDWERPILVNIGITLNQPLPKLPPKAAVHTPKHSS